MKEMVPSPYRCAVLAHDFLVLVCSPIFSSDMFDLRANLHVFETKTSHSFKFRCVTESVSSSSQLLDTPTRIILAGFSQYTLFIEVKMTCGPSVTAGDCMVGGTLLFSGVEVPVYDHQ